MEIILDGKFEDRLKQLAYSDSTVAHFWNNFKSNTSAERSALIHIIINLAEEKKELLRLARQVPKVGFNHDMLADYVPEESDRPPSYVINNRVRDLPFIDSEKLFAEEIVIGLPNDIKYIPPYTTLIAKFPTTEQVERSRNLFDLIEWLTTVSAAHELVQDDNDLKQEIQELLNLIQAKIVTLNNEKYFNPWNAFLLILLALLLIGSSFWIRYYAG